MIVFLISFIGLIQIAETLRNFILVVKSTQRNTTVIPTKLNTTALAAQGTASQAAQPASQLQLNSKITLTSSSTLSLPSSFVPLTSLSGLCDLVRVFESSNQPTLFFSLFLFSISGASKPTNVDASAKKLSMFKMAVPIDEEGNLFRCVDSQTKRVTVQRLEIVTPDYKDIEDLIQFLSKSASSLFPCSFLCQKFSLSN